MSEHDKKLIEEAEKMHYVDWPRIDDLIDKAESEEAKNRLFSIQKSQYHREEYHAGLL